MKRNLLTTLALGCAFAASAQTIFTKDGLSFETTSPSTVRVQKADKAAAPLFTIDVPESVEYEGTTYKVTSIGEEAFKWNNAVKVTLPETIDSIYNSAFTSTDITTINLPAKLTYIGDYAFNSSNIVNLEIPASVKYVGYGAFFTAKMLQTVKFDGNVEELGKSIFYHCTSLTKATLPDDMTEIADKMFMQCDKLADINLPSKLERIGEGAFYQCKALGNLTFPSTLKEIDEEAFLECSGITAIELPAALEELGGSAFSKTSIASIKLDSNNTHFKLVNDVLYSKDYTLLYLIPMKGKTSVSLMSACIGINGGAFWGSEIETVAMNKKLLAIDDYAFCQSSLKSITFPNTLVYVGEQAFAATQLSGDLRLPENVAIVQDGAFAQTNVTSVTIPSGVKYVYAHAFHNSSKLASVTCEGSKAPELVDVYEEYDSPFYNCPASTLNIPKGTSASYKSEYWDDYFTLKEGERGVLAVKSTSPEDNSMFTKKWFDAKVNITFDEEVTVVKAHPEVYLRKSTNELDATLSGNILEPDDEWYVTRQSDKKTVSVWAADDDSYTMTFSGNPGESFAFVIPAGIVKNAAGDMNEQIIVRVNAYDPNTGIAEAEVSASDAKEAARFNISGMKIGNGQKGINIIKMTDGSVKKVLVK